MSKSVKSAKSAAPTKAQAKPVKPTAKKTATPKTDPDLITESKPATSGKPSVVVTAGAGHVVIDEKRLTKQLHALIKVGGSFAAVQEYLKQNKGPISLAKGVDARNAPQSARAVAAQRGETELKHAPAARAPAPKAAKLPVKRSRADGSVSFTVLVKAKDSGLKPGSDRFQRLAAVEKAKTLGEALACVTADGKPIAMDNIRGMEKRGHVKLG